MLLLLLEEAFRCFGEISFSSPKGASQACRNFMKNYGLLFNPGTSVFVAPSYSLHAPAIIRVVGAAAACDSIVRGHLSTSRGVKVHVNIVAQDLLAKYHVTPA